ncbi:MAG TPA: TetR/AcrR family transcriptional regulator [Caulobacteraceae bacterium]|jgi:AcrR family transcriptional regulator|nr:TetR/AcrR family transcriptional regulator [Caulobacteraceae bacterium]
MPQTPRRRGDKRERTRLKLIEAALQVISEQGFAGASLDAIARRAGVTRGSIYSNFAGRDELMTAAVASQGMRLDREFSERLPLKAQLRRFGERLLEQFPAGARDGGLVIEFQLYAITQPGLRAQLAAAYAEMFATMATGLAAQYEGQLAISPRALALGVQALTMGLIWQFMLTPAEVRPEDVLGAFEALAVGAESGPGE